MPTRKPTTKKKTAVKKKTAGKPRQGVSTQHICREKIDELIRKIVEATTVDEKITWSWGVMSECRFLTSCDAVTKHLEECSPCRDFVRARKCLAEQIIKAGRA